MAFISYKHIRYMRIHWFWPCQRQQNIPQTTNCFLCSFIPAFDFRHKFWYIPYKTNLPSDCCMCDTLRFVGQVKYQIYSICAQKPFRQYTKHIHTVCACLYWCLESYGCNLSRIGRKLSKFIPTSHWSTNYNNNYKC